MGFFVAACLCVLISVALFTWGSLSAADILVEGVSRQPVGRQP